MSPNQTLRPLGHVLLTGGTGMVGGAVLRALIKADDVTRITSVGRRPSGHVDPKLVEIEMAGLDDAQALDPHLAGVDTVFHCLATYSSKVSRVDYRRITVDWLGNLLRATEQAAPGAHVALFSAAGARPDGGGFSFALRIKGEAENRLFESALPRKIAFRPAVIAPSVHRDRPTLGDRIATLVVPLIPASGMWSDDIAHAMLATMRRDTRTSAVLENRDMRRTLASS